MANDEKHKKHPEMGVLRQVGVDGRIPALSIDAQWKRAGEWFEFLEEDRDLDDPMMQTLNTAWDSMDADFVDRGEKLRTTSDCPFSVMFYCLEMGMYPPPELLFVLQDCWAIYLNNIGHMTLEEAFLGPTVKGVGNYASRKHSRYRLLGLRWRLDALIREGKTKKEAAEILSNQYNGKPDADSILRMMRAFGSWLAKKKG